MVCPIIDIVGRNLVLKLHDDNNVVTQDLGV